MWTTVSTFSFYYYWYQKLDRRFSAKACNNLVLLSYLDKLVKGLASKFRHVFNTSWGRAWRPGGSLKSFRGSHGFQRRKEREGGGEGEGEGRRGRGDQSLLAEYQEGIMEDWLPIRGGRVGWSLEYSRAFGGIKWILFWHNKNPPLQVEELSCGILVLVLYLFTSHSGLSPAAAI